ncbi:MAG TPA: hypothetical protein VGH19_15295 [Verrucomicrobiae bacterium]
MGYSREVPDGTGKGGLGDLVDFLGTCVHVPRFGLAELNGGTLILNPSPVMEKEERGMVRQYRQRGGDLFTFGHA